MRRRRELAPHTRVVSLRHLREESCELAEELLPPAAGEVNHLPAAFDAAADTGSLLLAVRTALRQTAHRQSGVSINKQGLGRGVDWSHQSRRAPDLLLDVVHQKPEDALVLLPSLVNPTGCQLENNIWERIVTVRGLFSK